VIVEIGKHSIQLNYLDERAIMLSRAVVVDSPLYVPLQISPGSVLRLCPHQNGRHGVNTYLLKGFVSQETIERLQPWALLCSLNRNRLPFSGYKCAKKV
jgi:hypothetical protein